MTAMTIDMDPACAPSHWRWPRADRPTLVAALFSLALHVGAGLLVMWAWVPSPPPKLPTTLQTQLIMLPSRPTPETSVATTAPSVPAPPAVATPKAPVQAAPVQVAPKPPIEQATLAKQRKEQQQALARKQQEARLQQEKRLLEQQRLQALAREAEQQRESQRLAAMHAAEAERAERARAAALVAAAQQPFVPMKKAAPDYPERALDKGIEGDCTVSYTVNSQGQVEHPEIVGECHPLFIKPSLAAAQGFRYSPRIVDGQPQPVHGVKNTFHYRIEQQVPN